MAQQLQRPVLCIEALVAETPTFGDDRITLQSRIISWISDRYVFLEIGMILEPAAFANDSTLHPNLLAVAVVSQTGTKSEHGFYKIVDHEFEVNIYSFRDSTDCPALSQLALRGHLPGLKAMNLPCKELHSEWESLVFEDALPQRLLRYTLRAMTFAESSAFEQGHFNWNRLCLLHGPPGSGKSTLCRGLAQKMSIRLLEGRKYEHFVLLEIDTSALLSKYFGESGKVIGEHFDAIQALAEVDASFVFVIIDEVESLASCRDKNNECTDGLRATNRLLTAIDQLRRQPNLIIWCTSNLINAIDTAFLSRVDVKQYIPCPSPGAMYEIFRSCFNSLIRRRLIHSNNFPCEIEDEPWTLSPAVEVPDLDHAKLRHLCNADAVESRLWSLAQRCVGLSGRACRRLPMHGILMLVETDSFSLEEALVALETVAEEEMRLLGRSSMSSTSNMFDNTI